MRKREGERERERGGGGEEEGEEDREREREWTVCRQAPTRSFIIEQRKYCSVNWIMSLP